MWDACAEHALSTETLAALFDNRIPAIRLEAFASGIECGAFIDGLEKVRLSYYRHLDPPVAYVGLSQGDHREAHQKDEYFRAVSSASRDLEKVYSNSFNPTERLISVLGPLLPGDLSIATEPAFGPYCHAIIRLMSTNFMLHADFAPFNAPGYEISKIDSQLTWNLFLTAPGGGGVTTIYETPWEPNAFLGGLPVSYGLPETTVLGKRSLSYRGRAGDVVIFNSRNLHRVMLGDLQTEEKRIQIGSFLGRTTNGDVVVWS
jgi:hypothetical protein